MTKRNANKVLPLRGLVAIGTGLLVVACGGALHQRVDTPTGENSLMLQDAMKEAIGELGLEPLCSPEAGGRITPHSEPLPRQATEQGVLVDATDIKTAREHKVAAKEYGWDVEDLALFLPKYKEKWAFTGLRTERLWMCTNDAWIQDYEVRAVARVCPSMLTGAMSQSKKEDAAEFKCEAKLIRELMPGCWKDERSATDEDFEQAYKDAREGLSPSISKTRARDLEYKGASCVQVGCFVKKQKRATFEQYLKDHPITCPKAQ